MAFKDVEDFEMEEDETAEAAAARYMKGITKDDDDDDDNGDKGEGDDGDDEGEGNGSDGGSDGEQNDGDGDPGNEGEKDGEDEGEGDGNDEGEADSGDDADSKSASDYFSEVAENLGVKLSDAPTPGFLPIKRKGKIDWLSPKDYSTMAMKGTDYTKKTMALAQVTNDLKKFKDADINDNDIEAMRLIKSGDFKKGLAMLSNGSNKSIDDLYDAATDIDEEYLKSAMPEVATPVKVFSEDVSEYFNSLPDEERNAVVEISKEGLLPPKFEETLMQDKVIMTSIVDDIHNGYGANVIRECNNKMELMDDYEHNKVLNNPSEYINLYIEVFKELYSNDSKNGATKKPTKDNPKGAKAPKKSADRDSIRKKNSQNFGKQHKKGNGSMKDQVLNDIESAQKMADDPEYLAKIAKEKYGVTIQ